MICFDLLYLLCAFTPAERGSLTSKRCTPACSYPAQMPWVSGPTAVPPLFSSLLALSLSCLVSSCLVLCSPLHVLSYLFPLSLPLHFIAEEKHSVLYCTVLPSQCGTVLYCTFLYCIEFYCILLLCIVLYFTALYCTVLKPTVTMSAAAVDA